MSFVDPQKSTFDAADFCEILRTAFGHGRLSTEAALKDTTSLTAASTALSTFLTHTKSKHPPDVIAAYVSYSTGAPELFSALRTVAIDRSIASVALDCLIEITRYSLQSDNPVSALDSARSVVREVPRSKAHLITNLLVKDRRSCARKALQLLQLVAKCHSLLAKEIVHNFDFTSNQLVSILCSPHNNLCRAPFLDLVISVLTCSKQDVHLFLSSNARPLLITCLSTITTRTVNEANTAQNVGQDTEPHSSNDYPTLQFTPLPSYVQRRELRAAIDFIRALRKHLFLGLEGHARSKTFAAPLCTMLARIASTALPPLFVSPIQVQDEQKGLREVARVLFTLVAQEADGYLLKQVANALLATDLVHGNSEAVLLTMKVVGQQPRLSALILNMGPFLRSSPQLSTKWLAYCSIISFCLVRVKYPLKAFVEHGFLEKCLGHTSPMVRHYGVIFTLSCCRLVRKHSDAMAHPELYLPSITVLKQSLRKESKGDGLVQSLLAQYQLVFAQSMEKRKTVLIETAINASGNNMLEAESAIRAALSVAPREMVHMAFNQKIFSKLVSQAVQSRDIYVSSRLWELCADLLRSSFLFPPSTESEVDVYLFVLSSLGTEADVCAACLERMVSVALANPYGLFDQLSELSSGSGEAATISLLSVTSLIRMRKMKVKDKAPPRKHLNKPLEVVLLQIFSLLLSCSTVLGTAREKYESLFTIVSELAPFELKWWKSELTRHEVQQEGHLLAASSFIQKALKRSPTRYWTPYLQLMASVSSYFVQSLSTESKISRPYISSERLDLAWDAWQDFNAGESLLSHRSAPSKRDMVSEALPSFFFPSDALDAASKSNIERQLSSLQQSLKNPDYAVLLCTILRITGPENVAPKLLRFIFSMPSNGEGGDELHNELLLFLFKSAIAIVRNAKSWGGLLLPEVALPCLTMLSECNEDALSLQKAEFAVAILYNLTRHRCLSVAVSTKNLLYNRTYLNSQNLCYISIHAMTELVYMLPWFPGFRKRLLEDIASWSSRSGRQFPISILIGVHGLLSIKERHITGIPFDSKWKESMLNIAEGLATSTYLSKNGHHDSNLPLIESSIRHFGYHVIMELSAAKDLVLLMKKLCGAFSKSLWMVWENSLHKDELFDSESLFPNESILLLFETIVKWVLIASPEVIDISFLKVFVQTILLIRSRKNLPLARVSDASELEQQLRIISKRFLVLVNHYHDFIAQSVSSDRSEREDGAVELCDLLCRCVSEILNMDFLLDEVAKDVLILVCQKEKRFEEYINLGLIASLGGSNETCELKDDSSANHVSDAAILLNVALKHLKKGSVGDEIGECLSHIERVFSKPLVYKASVSQTDRAIQDLLDNVSEVYRMHPRLQPSLDVRLGYLQQKASEVIPLFETRSLEEACDIILRPNTAEAPSCNSTNGTYDPRFVLKLFLHGCGEALEKHTHPVLDIGQITHDGLLGLVITGLASHVDDLRTLAYACIELFCKVVGPVHLRTTSISSVLYKDRKQLRLLLEVLRNSITEPLKRCLPLFVVWFRIALRVALQPRHPSNKIVTTFLLRNPSIDISDCIGLYHLFNCNATSEELVPTRSLALEVLEKGVHSRKDMTVVRKRRMINTCFMLASRKSLFNSLLRLKTLSTLKVLLERDFELDISRELVSVYGFLPWLLENSSSGEETERSLVLKLDLLQKLTKALHSHPDFTKRVSLVSTTLKKLGDIALGQWKTLPNVITRSLLNCATQLYTAVPDVRGSLHFSFSQLVDAGGLRSQDVGGMERLISDISKCIVRQKYAAVSLDVCKMLLEQTLLLTPDVPDLEHAYRHTEVLIFHSFIAECILNYRKAGQRSHYDSRLLELLAQVVCTQPTIWIMLAGYAAMGSRVHEGHMLYNYSRLLPSALPAVMSSYTEEKYAGVVKNEEMLRRLAACLIVYASQLRHKEARSVESKSEPLLG